MIKSAVSLALFLPILTVAGTISGEAYGSATGAPFNRALGQATACSYGGFGNTVLTGQCGYISSGTIGRTVQGGPDWSLTPDQFVAQIASSVDSNGSLHASVALQYTNEPVDVNFIHDNLQGSSAAFGDAYADSYDAMTFANTIPIQVVYNISVDGGFFQVDPQETTGYATFSYGTYYNGISFNDSDYYNTSGSHTYTMTAALVNPGGTASFNFGIHVSAELACTAIFGTHLCNANEGVDFSNTAKLTGITIEDLSGNVLSGYTITSLSGFDYNSLLAGAGTGPGPGTSTPEPGTILLVAAALAYCLFRRLAPMTMR